MVVRTYSGQPLIYIPLHAATATRQLCCSQLTRGFSGRRRLLRLLLWIRGVPSRSSYLRLTRRPILHLLATHFHGKFQSRQTVSFVWFAEGRPRGKERGAHTPQHLWPLEIQARDPSAYSLAAP